MNFPENCVRCNLVLHVDYQFVKDNLERKVRFWCRNGHSLIFNLVKEKELKITSKNKQDNTATILPPTRSRDRSVLCDICKVRIYNAAPNQKRHQDKCTRIFNRRYWLKTNMKKKLKKAARNGLSK